MRTLKTSLAVFRIKAAEGFAYRAAWISGAITSVFFIIIELVVFGVFYTYAADSLAGIKAGLSLRQVVTYTWLAQTLFLMQPSSVEQSIHRMITSGDVGIELCRPVDMYSLWFMRTGAGKIAPLAVRGSIIVVTGMLAGLFGWGIDAPASTAGLLLSMLAAVSAFFLCTSFGMLINAVRLNITWGEGPTYIMALVGLVLSGGYLPLQLWPHALQKFMVYQPFAGYMDIPLRLYVGSAHPSEAPLLLSIQLFWIIAFITCGRLVMRKRLRTVIVQGG